MDSIGGTEISIVIPMLDELGALRRLAASIETQSMQAREVIVVCGLPDDDIRAYCKAAGFRLIETEANRGTQRDRGAGIANGSVLWFVNVDASIGRTAIATITQAIADGVSGGCFRFAFAGRRTWRKSLIEKLVALRIRCGGMAYGDQALFATRDAYAATGGFTHDPLFDEVSVVKGLRKCFRFRVLDEPVFVATRRWERDGWIVRALRNRWLAIRYALGARKKALDCAYRRRPSRRETGT